MQMRMGKFDNRLSAWQDLQGKLKTICLAMLYIFGSDQRGRSANLSLDYIPLWK
jgi:hypothetical protein